MLLLNIPDIFCHIVAKIRYAFQMTKHFNKDGTGFRAAFALMESFQMIIKRFLDPNIDVLLTADDVLHCFSIENFRQNRGVTKIALHQ